MLLISWQRGFPQRMSQKLLVVSLVRPVLALMKAVLSFLILARGSEVRSSVSYSKIKRGKGKGSPYSITERRVPELIPVLGSQPAGDVSHKPGGRLSLLFARPAVTPTTLYRAATNFAAW